MSDSIIDPGTHIAFEDGSISGGANGGSSDVNIFNCDNCSFRSVQIISVISICAKMNFKK